MKKLFQSRQFYFIIFLFFLSIPLRILLLPGTNGDTITALIPWYDFIDENGLQALAHPFSNYSPPYIYLLFFSTWLKFLPKLVSIKVLSIIFDYIAAWIMYRLVRIKYPDGFVPWWAAVGTLFAPIVFIESSLWGQCDIIYTTFLLAFMLNMIRERPVQAMLFFSLAFSFKFQAIFITPFILIMLLKKEIPVWTLLLPPVLYLLFCIPPLIAGRPILDLLSIYINQAGYYPRLSYHAPNPYIFLNDLNFSTVLMVGIFVQTMVSFILALSTFRSKVKFSPERALMVATVITFLVPFLTPKMHNRFFFPASMMALALAFFNPKYTSIALALQVSSILAFIPFLQNDTSSAPLLVIIGAGINFIVFFSLFRTWLLEFFPNFGKKMRSPK